MNVGGWKFATSLGSLRTEKGSVLEKMFSDDFTVSRDNDGAVFIDRSGEHFNFILEYLRGNIVGLDDISFDENTRKMLIKEADYYQLEGMRNILAFKSNSVNKQDDCKAEIIEIVENVIQNKEAIRNILDESKSNERNGPSEANPASLTDLKRQTLYNRTYYYYETTKPMTFENKRWDNKDLARTIFKHSVIFKKCSFVNAKFDYCEFKPNTIVSFYRCDLINTSFTCADISHGKIQFDESDIRSAKFNNIHYLTDKIQNGAITFNKVKYVDAADFGNEAINAVIKLMNKIN